jgi:acyl carrier protein
MIIHQKLRQFIIDNFYVSDPGSLSDDSSLIAEGVVDSTGMLEVIAFIEAEFGFAVADDETTPENLETIGRMAAFVERRRRVPAAAGS